MNLYAFCRNNAVNAYDYLGMDTYLTMDNDGHLCVDSGGPTWDDLNQAALQAASRLEGCTPYFRDADDAIRFEIAEWRWNNMSAADQASVLQHMNQANANIATVNAVEKIFGTDAADSVRNAIADASDSNSALSGTAIAQALETAPLLAANGKTSGPLAVSLTNKKIANIIFNETRSLSGDSSQLAVMYQDLANVILNGNDLQISSGGAYKRSMTAPTSANPGNDQAIYDRILLNVQVARDARVYEGFDSTSGALNFNLRGDAGTGNWRNVSYMPLSTQNGPFNNSYTMKGLPATGVYVDTYYDTRWGPGP